MISKRINLTADERMLETRWDAEQAIHYHGFLGVLAFKFQVNDDGTVSVLVVYACDQEVYAKEHGPDMPVRVWLEGAQWVNEQLETNNARTSDKRKLEPTAY